MSCGDSDHPVSPDLCALHPLRAGRPRAGHAAGDRLPRTVQGQPGSRRSRTLRDHSREDPRRSRSRRSAQHDHSGSRSSRRATRAAESSTLQRLRWPSRWIPLGRPAPSFIKSSIAVTANQRRVRRGTSPSSAAGRATLPRPRQTRPSSSPSRGIGMDRPVTGPVIARFYNVPAGTNTVPIRLSSMGNGAASLLACRSRTAHGESDHAHLGELDRRQEGDP